MRDRIVVGVDGSSCTEAALAWAARLGVALGAEVVAVHAVGLIEEAHEHRWCARLVDAAAHRIEVVDGPAVDVLLHAAQRERAALMVLGARGIGGRPELALGSTSLRILQAAAVPTLVVPDTAPAETTAGRRRTRILVGVDRSPASLAALAVAGDLAHVLAGSLTVVEAFEFVPPFPLPCAGAGTRRAAGRDPLPTAAVLEHLVQELRTDQIAVEVVVRSGDPAATLVQVTDDIDADLVVVGSRGGGDPADPLLGSVARTVAARSHRPTLVVPSAAGPVRLTPKTARRTGVGSGAHFMV